MSPVSIMAVSVKVKIIKKNNLSFVGEKMRYISVFDFLKEDDGFYDVYRDCLSMEKQMIYESFDMSYVKGRTICEKLIRKIAKSNPKVSYLFSRKKKDGKPFIPGLAETLGACSDKRIISRKTGNKYYQIKKVGDAGAHGECIDEYNLNYSKKIHKMVFDITMECYNEFNYPIKVPYFYGLDENNKIENTPENRQEELNDLHLKEVAPDNTKEYYEFKKIFLTIGSFKECVSKYIDKFDKKEDFFNGLEKYHSINDENIDEILSDVEMGLKTKIKADVERLSHEISEKITETLNGLSADLTFEELNEMIDSAEDNDKREIYIFIRELSMDISRKYMARNKEKLEKVPVTYIDENGMKVSKHEEYDLKEDKNGFLLKIHLDADQYRAVTYKGKNPLVINAGPGSGKTRIIIERIVYLINELCIDPSTVLVITFTNKAAQELRNKLINETALSVEHVNQIKINTIHGLCQYLINQFETVPYLFLSYDEQILFFSKFKKELGFDNYAFLYDKWIPRVLELYDEFYCFEVDIDGLIGYIESLMDKNIQRFSSYEKYIDDFHERYGADRFPDFEFLKEHNFQLVHYYHIFLNIAYSYPKYKELLEANRVCDFNHLIEKAHEILINYDVRHSFRYDNILIDEFHDIDFHQMNIIRILQEICAENGSFTIVGDSNQSIYGWRGSTSSFFEDCVRDPNFKHITIHNNYRSSANIVEFNEELIKEYTLIEKKLIPIRPEGNPVFYLSNIESEEAANVIQIIENLKKGKKINYYSDVALLFRKNKDIEKFIDALEEYNLPYYNFASRRDFLNQNEIKSMLTLFWLLMPYHHDKFILMSDDFLNLSGLSDDYFALSKETQDILNDMQIKFEKEVLKYAHEALFIYGKPVEFLIYSDVFYQDEMIIDYVLDNVETFDIVLLEETDLIEIGITDANDLEFFSKLKNIKSKMWDSNLSYSEKPDYLDIFNELLNITGYFKEVSIRNDEKSRRIKDNLALFSLIINNYEENMCNKDYLGLFEYLNMILGEYSCPIKDANERFDKIHLMTMHQGKGLEYPAVILCSLKDEILSKRVKSFQIPHYLMGNKPPDIEKSQYIEEIRLLYVSATRARDLLIFSSITSNNHLPAFLESMINRNVKIKSLEPYNLDAVQKISSSIMNGREYVKTLNFEEILSDYLFCPYRYDILDDTCFSVSRDDKKNIELLLHQLVYRVHDGIDYFGIDEKIHSFIDYHDLADLGIFNNVGIYWREYGKNYNVIKSRVPVRKLMGNCEINGTVDLIVEEGDNEISIVQFIGFEDNVINYLDEYMKYQYFYTSIMNDAEEFKGYKFKNIILHSIDKNSVHIIPYQSKFEDEVLDNLEDIATNIFEEKFDKNLFKCVNCRFHGKYC